MASWCRRGSASPSRCARAHARLETRVPEGPARREPLGRQRETSPLRHPGLGDEYLQDLRLSFEHLTAERLDVKSDGRSNIVKGIIVCFPLTNDDSLETDGVCDVSVGMPFDNDFHSGIVTTPAKTPTFQSSSAD